jgi:hypothetical protein
MANECIKPVISFQVARPFLYIYIHIHPYVYITIAISMVT